MTGSLRRRTSTLWVGLCLGSMTGCEPIELLDNPMFDRFCGEELCYWTVEGDVTRVGTWHRNDYALAFESDGARIVQRVTGLEDLCTRRVELHMVGRVDTGTRLSLELDFDIDGDVDHTDTLPLTHAYRREHVEVDIPEGTERMEVAIVKLGTGRAELAQLSAREWEDACAIHVQIELGGTCAADDPCRDGGAGESASAGE